MGYEIGITEVGPAEYPLMEVLRESIFAPFGHRSLTSIADNVVGRHDVLALIAHLEGNPIGYKIGFRDRPGIYHSSSGGVLPDYRRLGLGRRMQDWQHQFAVARGYKTVYFNTFNYFRGMMHQALAAGFRPVGAEWRELKVMSFKFVKELAGELPAPPPSADREPLDPGQGRMEVEHQDTARLRRALNAGFDFTGIRHDTASCNAFVILEPSLTRPTT